MSRKTAQTVSKAAVTPTANQVVAYNLIRARELRGWTQEKAAENLSHHLGTRWSKASWSAAERSVDGVRIREFTADELAALSQAFGLPLGWWFLPPTDERLPANEEVRDGFAALHLGDEDGLTAYEERVAELRDIVAVGDAFATAVITNAVQAALARQAAERLENMRDVMMQFLKDVNDVVAEANEGGQQ